MDVFVVASWTLQEEIEVKLSVKLLQEMDSFEEKTQTQNRNEVPQIRFFATFFCCACPTVQPLVDKTNTCRTKKGVPVPRCATSRAEQVIDRESFLSSVKLFSLTFAPSFDWRKCLDSGIEIEVCSYWLTTWPRLVTIFHNNGGLSHPSERDNGNYKRKW